VIPLKQNNISTSVLA